MNRVLKIVGSGIIAWFAAPELLVLAPYIALALGVLLDIEIIRSLRTRRVPQ